MANFEIEVIEGEEFLALQSFFQETMRLLRELNEIGKTTLGELLFESVPLSYCRASLRDFGVYEETAYMALGDITQEHIRAHALEGIHLKSKLGIIVFYHHEFLKFSAASSRPVAEVRQLGPIGRRILKKLLASIDTLLESLFDGLPGGGAVIELKKQFETAVRD